MVTIVTRAGKGSPLTNAEVDANFTNLNSGKLEAASNLADLVDPSTARINLGLSIGANVQAWDADLDAIAAISGTSGLLRKTAANTWSLDSASYLTGNQTITLSGDASGSGATSINLTLADTGVAAGTYTKLTVDAKGRVTAGASLVSADLPTYTGSLTSTQVTTALGFTPYDATNPSGYITQNGNARLAIENNGMLVGIRRSLNFIPGTGISLTIADDSANEEVDVTINSTVTGGVTTFNTRSGAVTLSSTDVTTALGFTPASEDFAAAMAIALG